MRTQPIVEIDRKASLGVFALVAGTLSLLLLLASLQPPPGTPAEALSFAANHRTAYGWFASLTLAWSVSSVVLIVTLSTMLRAKGATVAAVAQLLSAIGVMLLAFAIFTQIGSQL
jgi:hypothetical protein